MQQAQTREGLGDGTVAIAPQQMAQSRWTGLAVSGQSAPHACALHGRSLHAGGRVREGGGLGSQIVFIILMCAQY